MREFAGADAPDSAKKPLQRNCCVHVLECVGGRFSLKETEPLNQLPRGSLSAFFVAQFVD